MSNVITFPSLIKQQVFTSLPRAKDYAMQFMLADVESSANIVSIDGEYLVTVFPADDLMTKAVANAKQEWKQ